MTTDDQLRELGKELPWDRPDAARREAVRSSLLVAAADSSRPRGARPWWIAGGGFVAGVAAAAVAILVIGRGGRPIEPRASIEASAQANFERELTRTATGTDEVVHLHAGKLRLSVGALATGDHVRVRTGDAEVEGAGDVEVAVAADAIREVTVRTGTARILVDGQQAVFLAAGETWHAPLITAAIEPSSPPNEPPAVVAPPPQANSIPTVTPPLHADAAAAVVRSPLDDNHSSVPHANDTTIAAAHANDVPAVVAPSSAEPPRRSDVTDHSARGGPGVHEATPVIAPPTPVTEPAKPETSQATRHAAIERAFQAGYALLRAGKADEAAKQLAAAADLDPSDSLAADARYLEATALVKAHRPAEAERALVAFLDHAGGSLRRGRASVMLARLIADRGDAKSARAWFEAALASTDPEVVAAARAGLATLH